MCKIFFRDEIVYGIHYLDLSEKYTIDQVER